ncbi:MAG: hypothetical protein SVW57_05205 [Thermodesulfobacteriota bacterium]|nr:hypothetical protein [Thermodesulfobacteriota bacterium]
MKIMVHPTKAYFVSWIAVILSLKNSISRNPYAWRFMTGVGNRFIFSLGKRFRKIGLTPYDMFKRKVERIVGRRFEIKKAGRKPII